MNNVLMILKLLPSIIEAIKAIEAAIPGEGKGEAKLALVRGVLETADNTLTQHWPTIQSVIALVVKTLNATGVFRK